MAQFSEVVQNSKLVDDTLAHQHGKQISPFYYDEANTRTPQKQRIATIGGSWDAKQHK